MIHGNDPTLLNVTYIRPDKRRGIEESFEVIYKTEDGRVLKSNEPAEATIYFVKPEFRNFNYNKPWERIERLEARRVMISQIRYEIAKEIGEEGKRFIEECFQNRDYQALNKLYGWRYVFRADFQEEFYFMDDWYKKYPPKNVRLTKAFMDIEIDQIDNMVDLDNLSGSAHAPVNCATIILEDTKEVKTFILRPFKPSRMSYGDPKEYKERYALYESQMEQHEHLMGNMNKFIKELHDDFDTTYGHFDYAVREYVEEIELITDMFRFINTRKPNFILFWNMRFDVQYLCERIRTLGSDPRSVMCHPEFVNPKCLFKIDKRWFQIEKQFDFFHCSSFSQFICQMRLYASIRKSQQMLKSVSLNAIGERELKDRKVDYPEETNMIMFPYKDWWRFIKYNIKDSLIQIGIERKTNDVMTYYSKSHSNLTPYSKIFRETHLLRNVREKFFNEEGWVQSNNLNIIGQDEDNLWDGLQTDNEDDDNGESTFKGAIMADPTMNAMVGTKILGQSSNVIFQNPMDYDMGAFYPSIKIASNMDPGTLLGKAEFNNEEFISGEMKNRSLNQTYQERDKHGKNRNLDITGEAVNTFATGNILTFGYNYLGLPSITNLAKDVIKVIKKK